MKDKLGFHLVIVTDEDVKNETRKLVSEITEEMISKFLFKGEPFYEIGRGHDFVYGFYNEYITKSGIRAKQYFSGYWNIGGDGYEIKNEEFIKIPKAGSYPIDWGKLSFPIVKKVNAKTIASELISVTPEPNTKKNER